MEYQSYEDYMRNVLGYNQIPNNIYANTYNDFYETQPAYREENTERLNEFYPEIYKMVYPMVCKICNQNMHREITKELIDNMTEEIYNSFEAEDRPITTQTPRPQLRNGDVKNPNIKEPEIKIETRQSNFLLRDLIRILILREILRPRRPPYFGRPPMQPPSRPPYRPPIQPRNYWN